MAKKTEFSLETVKKYVFWAIIPIGLLFPLFTTLSAVGSITKLFEDRKNVLKSTKDATEKIAAEKSYPNENTITDIENCKNELIGRVVQAWKTLEKDQREKNLWPIGDEFREEVSKLKFFDEMTINAREKYLNFVNKYLPSLEIYVDRRRVQKKNEITGEWEEWDPTKGAAAATASTSGGSSDYGEGSGSVAQMGDMNIMGSSEPPLARGPNGEEIYRYTGTVDWSNPETRAVTSSWVKLPKSNEVWFAQEELWVYHALLSVVKESNLEATGPHNAVVKRIENLLIGQSASALLDARSSSRISKAGSAGGAGGLSSSSDSSLGGGAAALTIARTEEDVITIKKNNRYVDNKAKPLKATEDSQFKQFKRMPICLRLIVDQRKIPEILVNCANCAMPIDVLWVRFNPAAVKPFDLSAFDASVAASGAAGGSPSSSGSGSSDSSSGGGYGDEGGGNAGGTGSASGDVQIRIDNVGGIYGTNAIPIEIYGCINIFNPVEHGGLQLVPSTSVTPAAERPDAPPEVAPAAP